MAKKSKANSSPLSSKTSSMNKSPTNWHKESKMRMPDVPNVAVDSNGKVKVTVWAYRKLTEDELHLQVVTFCDKRKSKQVLNMTSGQPLEQ